MPQATVMTAQLMCTMGMAPSVLAVLPKNKTMCGKQVAANIMDNIPMTNIMPFGMCISPANPTVAAATAAALGVLTPMPCIPVNRSTLGARCAYGHAGEHAHAGQYVQVHVQLDRGDQHRLPGAGDDLYSLGGFSQGGAKGSIPRLLRRIRARLR